MAYVKTYAILCDSRVFDARHSFTTLTSLPV